MGRTSGCGDSGVDGEVALIQRGFQPHVPASGAVATVRGGVAAVPTQAACSADPLRHMDPLQRERLGLLSKDPNFLAGVPGDNDC